MTQAILRHTILAAALTGSVVAAQAATPAPSDDWQYALDIYGWFPTIGGSLKYPLPSGIVAEVDAGPDDYLQDLQFAFMGSFLARKGDWSILADLIYLDLSGQTGKATVPRLPGGSGLELNADNSLKGMLFQVAGAYTVARSENANLDVLLGLRYAGFDTDTDLSIEGPLPAPLLTAHLSDSVNLVDGIIGVKGQVAWGGNWFSPYYLDIGTGDTEFTWQALAGVGYRWDWGDLILAYRYLSYDMGSDKLLQDTDFSGPALGVTFRF
ncbi:MAG TPA: hypothetical protein PKH28_01965 [Candidatus Competibacteraceae bacterium]|nr:hypothetical protein [Candidatus Competibacteraceae bacterium]